MLIDGQKRACEACIRGHRVTSCRHNDRPLTRINRKGRPFSTCPLCHCSPCKAPDAHSKLKREADAKSPSHASKKATSRHCRPCAGFLPIAPRPSTAPAVSRQTAVRDEDRPIPLPLSSSSMPGTESEAIPFRFAEPVAQTGSLGAAGVSQPPALSDSFPSASSLSDIPLSMPMGMVSPLEDANGFPSFYSDPAVLESTAAFCALDGMAEPVLQGDWCSNHFWPTGDPL